MKKVLPKNIHPWERVFRFLLGAFLISLVFWGPQTAWGLIGLVPLATAFVGSCPLYTLLGLTTCRRCENPSPSGG